MITFDVWATTGPRSMFQSTWTRWRSLELCVHQSRVESVTDFVLVNVRSKTPGRGDFTLFLDEFAELGMFVENVLNERFGRYLGRHGYVITNGLNYPPCYALASAVTEHVRTGAPLR